MKHSRLGLLLANLHRRVKLIVKRNIGWGGGDSQSATVLRWTLNLAICATI